jgi:small subunit ribosomal protein S3
MGSSKAMIGKFTEGYLKHCGQPSKELVGEGYEEANTRPGKIGVKVRIMTQFVDITGEKRTTRYPVKAKEEPKKEEEAKPEPEKKPKKAKKAPKPKAGKKKAGPKKAKPKKPAKKKAKAKK